MAFRNGSYATIWEIKKGTGNYTDVRISTSRKDKQTDEYVTDFSGFVRLIGDAHKNAGSLGEKSRIKIGDCAVTNSYDKEKKVTYTNFQVFSFEMADGSTPQKAQNKPPMDSFVNVDDGLDMEELPFA